MGRTMLAAGLSVKTRGEISRAPLTPVNRRRRDRADFAANLPRMRQEPSGFERISLPARQTHNGRAVAATPKGGRVMSLDFNLQPLELRRVSEHARVFVLLPTLAELLGEPGFGRRDSIVLPGHKRPLDGWALFGMVRERGFTLH